MLECKILREDWDHGREAVKRTFDRSSCCAFAQALLRALGASSVMCSKSSAGFCLNGIYKRYDAYGAEDIVERFDNDLPPPQFPVTVTLTEIQE